ncbi:MAG: FKBP-type peptidyl-prolyl cis-trans isomerase [Phycisphaerales bacterium]
MRRESLMKVRRRASIAFGVALGVLGGCASESSSTRRDVRTHAETGDVKNEPVVAEQPPKTGASGAKTQGDPMASNNPGVELYETPSGKKLPGLSTIKFPSGVVATDLVFGSGATAMPNSVIKVHYHGTLPDGKVFDSTRGSEPVKFPLNQLIPGWREGIPGMMVGGVRRLVVPAKDAYGDEGAPPDIPPKTDLIFTIELVEVVEKK